MLRRSAPLSSWSHFDKRQDDAARMIGSTVDDVLPAVQLMFWSRTREARELCNAWILASDLPVVSVNELLHTE